MKKNQFKAILLGSAIVLGTMASCKKNNGPDEVAKDASGPDRWDREFITLTASFPDETGTAGNGGTVAYSLTQDEALDDKKHINIYVNGFSLRSQRTARVQASKNGNFLYNIQYTGVNGGIFNKYRVNGAGNFTETGEEVNTAPLLGTSPRWVKAAEGIGIGVNISGAAAPIDPVKAEAGTPQPYEYVRGTAKVAIIDLDDPRVPNSTEFEFPFTKEEKEAGYSVSRLDVPVLNAAKTKIFIGCAINKVNPTGTPVKSVNRNGDVTWSWPSDAANIKGTVTLVLDYPSLANPKLIWSTKANVGNNSYRTMTQYVGDDNYVYQSTGANTTSYPFILRIDPNINEYDNSYVFNLGEKLGITTGRVGIKAWTYIKGGNGKAIALYDIDGKGGYIALIDVVAGTATKIANDYEATLSLGQYQNIGVAGDYAYIPLTPPGEVGRLYLVNWKTGEVKKGVHLTGGSGSSYIGSY